MRDVCDFTVTVPGKWVLAGEHSVLRGGRAIALPHPRFSLTLNHRVGEGFRILPESSARTFVQLWGIGDEWFRARGKSLPPFRGILSVESTIPQGAGLGSSAALSVAMGRWFFHWLGEEASSRDALIDLARTLEHHFHGQSSGMDVATVTHHEPILFSMKEGARLLSLREIPEFHFHDTGVRASTRDCIESVQRLVQLDPVRAAELDEEMARAVALAHDGLLAFPTAPETARELLRNSMRLSSQVYRGFGLITENVRPQLADLNSSSKRAARLTGAGMGGFIVSLGD